MNIANEIQIPTRTAGLILAGGQGSRMGGKDKGLLTVHGQSLTQYAVNLLTQLSVPIIINCNRNLEFYRAFAATLVMDKEIPRTEHSADVGGNGLKSQGPLAGIYQSLLTARAQGHEQLLIIPVDAPLLDANILEKLLKVFADSSKEVAISQDGEQLQPLVSIIKTSLVTSLEYYLQQGKRKTQDWMQAQEHEVVHFSYPERSLSPFTNINDPSTLAAVESHGLPHA